MVPKGVRRSAGRKEVMDTSIDATIASYSPSLSAIFISSAPKPVTILFSSLRFSPTDALLIKVGKRSVFVIFTLIESSE